MIIGCIYPARPFACSGGCSVTEGGGWRVFSSVYGYFAIKSRVKSTMEGLQYCRGIPGWNLGDVMSIVDGKE